MKKLKADREKENYDKLTALGLERYVKNKTLDSEKRKLLEKAQLDVEAALSGLKTTKWSKDSRPWSDSITIPVPPIPKAKKKKKKKKPQAKVVPPSNRIDSIVDL